MINFLLLLLVALTLLIIGKHILAFCYISLETSASKRIAGNRLGLQIVLLHAWTLLRASTVKRRL